MNNAFYYLRYISFHRMSDIDLIMLQRKTTCTVFYSAVFFRHSYSLSQLHNKIYIWWSGSYFSYICLHVYKILKVFSDDDRARALFLSTRTDTQAFSTFLKQGYILPYILLLLKINNNYLLTETQKIRFYFCKPVLLGNCFSFSWHESEESTLISINVLLS